MGKSEHLEDTNEPIPLGDATSCIGRYQRLNPSSLVFGPSYAGNERFSAIPLSPVTLPSNIMMINGTTSPLAALHYV